MSQQGHWKASALAATFSSNAGFNGTAWGAARPPLHMGSEIGFGLGFGQGFVQSPMLADAAPLAAEPGMRRQKRKASSEDESMDSSSPTPEPATRKIRSIDSRRPSLDEDPVAAVINGSPAGRRIGSARSQLGSPTPGSDGRKRTRMMDSAAPNEVTLDKLLEPLEEKDLRLLLDTLIAQNPHLGGQVRQLVPKPTVNSACSQLMRLERRLLAAFPYNKAGPAADDYTYHRVKPALEELRDTILMYLDHFTHYGLHTASANALSHPAEWFDLLTQATDVAVRMPKWDRQPNNAIRRETLRLLADGWLRAIMATARWSEEGHIAGRDMLSRWAQQLERFYADEPALFEPAVQVFQRSFGQYRPRVPARAPASST
ncbi:Tethering factor for nuclear proteasome sts1 [Coemansia sp. RSA 2618]|nr:Tethering factor for nuclear proteasome sts1 [Coemansia sp. RSA 2618]